MDLLLKKKNLPNHARYWRHWRPQFGQVLPLVRVKLRGRERLPQHRWRARHGWCHQNSRVMLILLVQPSSLRSLPDITSGSVSSNAMVMVAPIMAPPIMATAAVPIMERAESTQQIHLSSGKLTFECVRK